MKTLVGIRPTGRLHIGHYFSVIRPAIEERATVLVASYHGQPELTEQTVNNLVIFGVYRSQIVRQTKNFNPEIYFRLLNYARDGELKRMTQFKSKEKTAHMYCYPVLMAHDVVGYDRVIVGEDQKQHGEYIKVLLKRAGARCPKFDYRGGRVMSLTNPRKKMSKSEPKGCLFLDRPETKHAVTTPTGIKNLAYIYGELTANMWDPKNNEIMKVALKEAVKDLL